MFCTNCGSKLADGAKFCSECGARVVRPEEPVFRTNPEITFEEPKVAEPVIEAPVYDEAPEKPVRETISFDWSNVVDEPARREVKDIKSPWDTTGDIDEKSIYAEMTPSTEKSRTMSFIDVLKAEKEEKEKAAAEKAIEYTEVLQFDPDLTAFEEPPKLHIAPLYEDVDEPVITPFDLPEEEAKAEPVFEDEPRFEFEEPKFDFDELEVEKDEPEIAEPEEEPEIVETEEEPEVEEIKIAEPEAEEVEAEEPEAEPVVEEEPARMAEVAEEPALEVSRETIAQFDEYVKSFEKEAGIISEPEFEEPKIEEPKVEAPKTEFKFELPDFLKKMTDFSSRKEEAPVAEETPAEEPAVEEPVVEDLVVEEPEFEEDPLFEEPEFEEPAAEELFVPEITPDIDELFAGLTPASFTAEEEEPEVEPEFEETEESMEDLYLDFKHHIRTYNALRRKCV